MVTLPRQKGAEAFTRYSDLYFTPDPLGDLIFLGIAQTAERSDLAIGVQTDAAWKITLNLFDRVYEIRNGTGVGVSAPQFGMRRTILAGLAKRF